MSVEKLQKDLREVYSAYKRDNKAAAKKFMKSLSQDERKLVLKIIASKNNKIDDATDKLTSLQAKFDNMKTIKNIKGHDTNVLKKVSRAVKNMRHRTSTGKIFDALETDRKERLKFTPF